MSTQFQKHIALDRPDRNSLRTFAVSFRVAQTRQQYMVSQEFKIAEIYDDAAQFKLKMLEQFDKLLQSYLETLPV